MCCNTRTHVIVILIIYLVLIGISATWFGYIASDILAEHAELCLIEIHLSGCQLHLYVAITAIFYVFWATCEILCIIGAVNNNKCLLVPFMICLSLTIVACFGFGIFSGAAFDKSIFVRFDGIDLSLIHI